MLVLGVGARVVAADEGDAGAVRRHGRTVVVAGVVRQCPDVAVQRNEIQIAGKVAIPRVVALRTGDDTTRIGQPRDAVVLEIAGGEVARRRRAIRRHNVDMRGAIEDETLAVEPREEPFDLARRLPAFVVGRVALVLGAADERDRTAVGAPLDAVDTVLHRRNGPQLARSVHRQHMQRRLPLLLAASGCEREAAAIGAPRRVAVTLLAVGEWPWGSAAVGRCDPQLGAVAVLGEIHLGDLEHDLGAVRGDGGAGSCDDAGDDAFSDFGVLGLCFSHCDDGSRAVYP